MPKRHQVNHSEQVARILGIYGRANALELQEGQSWYETANALAVGIASKNGLSVPQAAGIVAALSPQMSWEYNQVAAERLAAGLKVGALGTSIRKAEKIRDNPGTDPLDILGGDKVRAFYTCILAPKTSDAVCIDRHALDLAEGLFSNTGEGRATLLGKVGVYEQVAESYRRVAKVLGVPPHIVQAVTWVTWRNLKRVVNAPPA
jgi:hypothetical protein